MSEPERTAASTTSTPKATAGDDAVAAREMARLRHGADRHLRDQHAALGDRLVQLAVLLGVDAVDAAAEDGDRAGRHGALMGRGVDAARQAGDDDEAALPELQRHVAGEAPAIGRGVARADDGDGRPLQHLSIAADREQGRGVVDRREGGWIVGLAPGDEARAGAVERGELALGGALWKTSVSRRSRPPRRAISGSASSAAAAEPKRASS